jgi:hypothetical protein
VPFPAAHLAPPPRRVREVDIFVDVDAARSVVGVDVEIARMGTTNCPNKSDAINKPRTDPDKTSLRIRPLLRITYSSTNK